MGADYVRDYAESAIDAWKRKPAQTRYACYVTTAVALLCLTRPTVQVGIKHFIFTFRAQHHIMTTYTPPRWYHGYQWQKPVQGDMEPTPLSRALCKFFANEHLRLGRNITVVELGCGYGPNVYNLNLVKGVKALGVDGHTSIATLGKNYMQGDLKVHTPLDTDYVITFEVGEHVPHESENIFLGTIRQARVAAIIGWARPGQGGNGHVNERSPEYVIERMATPLLEGEEPAPAPGSGLSAGIFGPTTSAAAVKHAGKHQTAFASAAPKARAATASNAFEYSPVIVSRIRDVMAAENLDYGHMFYYSNLVAFEHHARPDIPELDQGDSTLAPSISQSLCPKGGPKGANCGR